MTLAVQQALMPVEDFLDRHPGGEKRELIGGLPIRMMAEGDLHDTVGTNVAGALSRRLRPPSACRPGVYRPLMKIDDLTSYRPDAHVDCASSSDPMASLTQCPTVVVEASVTSPQRDMPYRRDNRSRHPDGTVSLDIPVAQFFEFLAEGR